MKTIDQAKNLINLPYNKFNLDNYFNVLTETYGEELKFTSTFKNQPIRLMSGEHSLSGIVRLNNRTTKRNIFLVGKGILFDSGGLNLKTRGMEEMTGDKAGMITALAVADHFKENVVAFCPVTTNFIHTSMIIPGDEIDIGRKTVKITDTDAEGRLILAEALTELNASKNDIVITIATLTGAVGYAIDDRATGVFSLNDKLAKSYIESSIEAKEYAWRLPLFDYMQKDYDKRIVPNYNKNIKAGASEAGMFLKQFVKYENNWLHLDIAYSAFNKSKQASGVPINTLINFIEKIK